MAEEETANVVDVVREESEYDFRSDDTDTISLTDTVASQYDDDVEWPLEDILAQASVDESDHEGNVVTVQKFLVKWTGYSRYRATWQVESDFKGEAKKTLWKWHDRYMNIKRGLDPGLDLAEWQDELDKIDYLKKQRQRLRNKKRRRLGQEEVIYPNSDDEDGDDEQSEIEDVRPVGKSISRQNAVTSGSDVMDTAESEDDDTPLVRRTSVVPVQANARRAGARKGSPAKRGPFEDESSDEDESTTPVNAPKKRRTAAAAEQDRQKTRELQKKKKGMAVLASSKQSVKSVAVSRPAAVTKRPSGPTKPSGFFDTLKRPPQARPKPLLPSAPGGGSSSVTTQFTAPTARMGTMVGGPSGKAKPVAPTGSGDKSKQRKLNIFSTTSSGALKRGNEVTNRKPKTISHRNNILKKQRNEPAPDISNLQLFDPSATRNASSIQSSPRRPPAPRQASVEAPSITRKVAFQESPKGRATAQPTKRQSPTPIRSRSASTSETQREDTAFRALTDFRERNASELAQRHEASMIESTDIAPHISAREGSPYHMYTCFHWAEGSDCYHGSSCEFEHHDVGRVAPRNNIIPPEQITCMFWYNRKEGCRRSADTCKFEHARTFYLARVGGHVTRLRPDGEDVVTQRTEVPAGDMSCWHWFFESPACRLTDSACRFAHAQRPLIAPAPRSRDSVGRNNTYPTVPIAYEDGLEIKRRKSGRPIVSETVEYGSTSKEPSSSPTSAMRPVRSTSSPQTALLPLTRLTRRDDDHDRVAHIPFNFQIQHQVRPLVSERKAYMKGEYVRAIFTIIQSGRDDSAPLTTYLDMPDSQARSKVLDLSKHRLQADSPSTMVLEIQKMCIAELAREYFDASKQRIITSGDVYPADSEDIQLGNFTETLRSHSAGAMAQDHDFTVFVFPAGQQVWNFLNVKRPSPGVQLQFTITSPIPNSPIPLQASSEPIEDAPSAEPLDLKLDAKVLFAGAPERNAFLMFHPEYRSELDLLMEALHSMGTTVYLLGDVGAWTYFSTKVKYGAVIVHPSFDDFHLIPGLVSILQGPHRRFFSFDAFSAGNSSAPYPQILPTIFPHGRAVLIMDNLWEKHPEDIEHLVKTIEIRIRNNPDSNCILGRPDLLRWLEKLYLDDLSKPNVSKDKLKAREQLFHKVHSMLHAKRAYRGVWPEPDCPTRSSPIFFEPSANMPGYEEVFDTDRAKAEDIMIDWFALWSLRHVHKYRAFIVVYLDERVDSNQKEVWMKRYKHIDVVTPVKYNEAVRGADDYNKEKRREFEEAKRASDRAKAEGSSEHGSNA